MTAERRIEEERGWTAEWEAAVQAPEKPEAQEGVEQETDYTGPIAGSAEDSGPVPVGRRSLYEELGLSLDIYDDQAVAGGDDPAQLPRFGAAPELPDFDNLEYTGEFTGPITPEPPEESAFPPGSLSTTEYSYPGYETTPPGGLVPASDLSPAPITPTPPPALYAPDYAPDYATEYAPEPTTGPQAYSVAQRFQLNLDSAEEHPTAAHLTADRVLRSRRPAPTKGWRKGLMKTTGINLGPGAKELHRRELEDRVRVPINGCYRLAVISLKGGVGKTTTIAALGSVFASLRGDRVIAIDANPDRGTLGEKTVGEITPTVRDFVARSATLHRYVDVRQYTAQAQSRLEVIASESDPLKSMAFSEQDYRIVSDVLERFYSLILTDCGTGLLHSAMVGVLAQADAIVVVSSASLDGARSASATLDWLEAHGYNDLAREAVTVISEVRPRAGAVDLDEIEDHFASRCRAVARIPYDPHLSAGGRIELDQLNAFTYESYLHLAAAVAEGFGKVPGQF